MSKEAALRAMREAAYRERTAGTAVAPKRARPAVRPAGTKDVAAAPPETDALCGHRSMNGRTCTREQGHEAKSHRYG
jgi:hypothetical protein